MKSFKTVIAFTEDETGQEETLARLRFVLSRMFGVCNVYMPYDTDGTIVINVKASHRIDGQDTNK